MSVKTAGMAAQIRKDFPWYILGLCALWLMYSSGLLNTWTQSEDYGHGAMVVAVLGYVLYRRRAALLPIRPGSFWSVVPTALLACGLVVAGETSGIAFLGNYGLWLFGVAVILAFGGWHLLRHLIVPLLIIVLLFPLPQPLGPMLTAELQLVSSRLGVWVIRALGGSVYLEGNVLDMGSTKLLVAEACAGLRYLFPLLSLGAIIGYIMNAALWVRLGVFLMAAPITIFMNSFRIGVTGLLVDGGGSAHTEGFLHFFEGWVVFVLATLLLMAVAWLLVRLQRGQHSLSDALHAGLAGPDAGEASGLGASPESPDAGRRGPLVASALLMTIASLVTGAIVLREPGVVERKRLDEIPSALGDWTARRDRLPAIVEQVAGASEYFFADFISPSAEAVNVYVSYYETQKQGQIPHSPKVCLPGGGWKIERIDPVNVSGPNGQVISVNRMVTSMGPQRMLAYYWLKQGASTYRKEGLARLDLIRFSLLENRTDGALIRLVTDVKAGDGADAADRRLSAMALELNRVITTYVPD